MTASAEKIFALNMERLETYMDEHHMRHTMERETVLMRACELGNAFTADELIEAVQTDFISRPTVYNTLQLLLKAGIVHCMGKEQGRSNTKYELTKAHLNHMQLTCTRCGRVSDFQDAAITNILKSRKYNNFNMKHFVLHVYGECKLCRRKNIKR